MKNPIYPFDAASHLNTVDAITAPHSTQNLNSWPDEAWDSEGNHWVQDESGWHWHCNNPHCTKFTKGEFFSEMDTDTFRRAQERYDAMEHPDYWREDEPEPEQDRGDLRDDGRSDGHGESYAERNA